eukprot:3866344-Rhodomonas_salina.1
MRRLLGVATEVMCGPAHAFAMRCLSTHAFAMRCPVPSWAVLPLYVPTRLLCDVRYPGTDLGSVATQ